MISAKRDGKTITRNSSFFKKSPNEPVSVTCDTDDEDNDELESATLPDSVGNVPGSSDVVEDLPKENGEIRPKRNIRLPAQFKDFVISK